MSAGARTRQPARGAQRRSPDAPPRRGRPRAARYRADHPAADQARPAEERQPGEGAREGAKSQGAQGCPAPVARAAPRPDLGDRPQPAHAGSQGAVRRAGHRIARAGPRRHAVAVDRRRRAVVSAGQRQADQSGAAAAEGSARARRARGPGRARPRRVRPRARHDPVPRHRAPRAGSGGKLDRRRHSQTGRRRSAAAAQHAAARRHPRAARTGRREQAGTAAGRRSSRDGRPGARTWPACSAAPAAAARHLRPIRQPSRWRCRCRTARTEPAASRPRSDPRSRRPHRWPAVAAAAAPQPPAAPAAPAPAEQFGPVTATVPGAPT